VEVFSAGWHQKSIFQRHEASPALSVEFLPDIYDFNEYTLTWVELSRRPLIAEGIGEQRERRISNLFYLSFSPMQRTASLHVPSSMHVSMHQFGATAEFIVHPDMTSRLFTVRGYCACQQKYWRCFVSLWFSSAVRGYSTLTGNALSFLFYCRSTVFFVAAFFCKFE
jgi:hypothetical protein